MQFESLHINHTQQETSGVEPSAWDAYRQPQIIEVSATAGAPASSNDTNTNTNKNTNSNSNANTVKDTVTVTDTVRDTQTSTIASGLLGLATGAAIARREDSGSKTGSGCVPFSVHADALIFGAGVTTPNTACVEHPQDLDYSLSAASQAVKTMEVAGDKAKQAISEGKTGQGKVDLDVANFDAAVSAHLAGSSAAAADRALGTPATTPAPQWSADMLNKNSPN